MKNIKYKMSECSVGSEYSMDQAYNQLLDVTADKANTKASVTSICDTKALSDSDLDKLCGEHNEYLMLLRRVVDQSFDLIQQWAPIRYIEERTPTIKMLELARTEIERVAVCLMALKDVPEVARYKGMGAEEIRLTRVFLQQLDAYLCDNNLSLQA